MKSTRNVSGIDCMMNLDAQAEYFQYKKRKCNQGAMLMKGKYVSFYWRSWKIETQMLILGPRTASLLMIRQLWPFMRETDKRNKVAAVKFLKLELPFIIRAP